MWVLLMLPKMQTITTIGLDIAKSVFHVHGIDAEGKVPDAPSHPELVGLDRVRAKAELGRGQEQARQHQQASRAIAICAAGSPPATLAVIRYARIHGTQHRPWLTALLA